MQTIELIDGGSQGVVKLDDNKSILIFFDESKVCYYNKADDTAKWYECVTLPKLNYLLIQLINGKI